MLCILTVKRGRLDDSWTQRNRYTRHKNSVTHRESLSRGVQGKQKQMPKVLRGSLNLTRQSLPDYIPLFETTALVCSVLAQAQEFQRAHLLLHVVLQERTVLLAAHLFHLVCNTTYQQFKKIKIQINFSKYQQNTGFEVRVWSYKSAVHKWMVIFIWGWRKHPAIAIAPSLLICITLLSAYARE